MPKQWVNVPIHEEEARTEAEENCQVLETEPPV